MRAESFDPVVGAKPRILILGSMPGNDSLQAGQYYAHPRNGFWRILGDLKCCRQAAAYDDRLDSLRRRGIALWDVLKTCDREGSLDSRIVRASERPNDLSPFLNGHPTIRAVFFNGGKAERAFREYIQPRLSSSQRTSIAMQRLPSTSPAHAIPYERKLDAWRAILRPLDSMSCRSNTERPRLRDGG